MESVLILDFGGQYSQVIARRVREQHVHAVVRPYRTPISDICAAGYKGIILTGGPNSVYADGAPRCSPELLTLGVPVLGICYGAQLLAYLCGGTVAPAPRPEYGNTAVTLDPSGALFAKLSTEQVCWMSHGDFIAAPPTGFRVTAHTADCPCAAMEDA
ncbi:MAG: gamma-glutamyl-gamma-aminobutyrate hydrolase family protein, partial [Oscillospiraceae bacterium]|nr:gamma-glutamyl-gamma-aminobutyrate hydrolase family protein [Oscillospiraceae bacterium]